MDTYFVMIAFLHHKPNYVKKKRKLGVHNIGFFADTKIFSYSFWPIANVDTNICTYLFGTSGLFCSGTNTMCLILLS